MVRFTGDYFKEYVDQEECHCIFKRVTFPVPDGIPATEECHRTSRQNPAL